MSMTHVGLAVLFGLAAASAAHSQTSVTKANSVTATATIQAIDSTSRRITSTDGDSLQSSMSFL